MRNFYSYLFFVGSLSLFSVPTVTAQCAFTPTITPNPFIFYCADQTDTLYTEVYDAYQWYDNGAAIPGANQQFLVVDQMNYSGHYISMAATLGGCTELADSVLLDQWVTLPPFIITHTTPLYIQGLGEAWYCHEDTVILQAVGPFGNIIWLRYGMVLAGETDDTLRITNNGNYTAYGSYGYCPGDSIYVGVDVPIRFRNAFVPVIQYQAPNLVTHDGETWQWYLNGNPLVGATDSILNNPGAGTYYVEATDSFGCEGNSTPYVLEPSAVENPMGMGYINIFPNPSAGLIRIDAWAEVDEIIITDLSGKMIYIQKNTNMVDLTQAANGIYMVTVLVKGERSTKRFVIQH
jgi:hypothetical protein